MQVLLDLLASTIWKNMERMDILADFVNSS